MTNPSGVRRCVGWPMAALCVWLMATAAASAQRHGAPVAEAAKTRDRSAVAALLKQGAAVNTPLPDGATALHWAAHWDDIQTAQLLLRFKAAINVANDFGVTPLSLACSDASDAMVDLLLTAGADPNLALPSGETPLMTAVRANKIASVKALLARGARVDATERSKGQTALMWAFSRKHLEIARVLIEQGANVRTRSDAGFSPLLFAARTGSFDAVRSLLDLGADVNEAAADGTSVLHVAIVRGHAELTKYLLSRGANPNAVGPGYSALHWAAGTWDSQTTREYLANPPQPAGWDEEWRVLIGLQGTSKAEVIKALLGHGADPNMRMTKSPPRFGYSFQSFIRAGGSLAGATPFALAAMAGDAPTMRLLVAGGADPLMATTDGTTPLMAAAGLTVIEEEMSTPEDQRVEAAQLAVSLGADMDAANDQGNTALHGTGLLGFPKVAEYLITHGAVVNPLNKIGETPLRIAEGTIINAMFFIHESVAKVLRAHGGTSDGSGVCTPGILERASVNAKSTVCEPVTAKPAQASPPKAQ